MIKHIIIVMVLLSRFAFSNQIAYVTGLDATGDNFLAVRTHPNGEQIGSLHNGNKRLLAKLS